jgi:hypothetical protein
VQFLNQLLRQIAATMCPENYGSNVADLGVNWTPAAVTSVTTTVPKTEVLRTDGTTGRGMIKVRGFTQEP